MERLTLYEVLVGSGFFLWFVKYLVSKIIESYMDQRKEIERLKETWVSQKIESLEKSVGSLQSSIDLHKIEMAEVKTEFKAARVELAHTKEKRDSLLSALEGYVNTMAKRMDALEKSKIVKQGDVYIFKKGES